MKHQVDLVRCVYCGSNYVLMNNHGGCVMGCPGNVVVLHRWEFETKGNRTVRQKQIRI